MIFSVIVPFFNEKSHITECVESLLTQTFDSKEYEIIFVDNNSTDESYKILEKYPQIIYRREKKPGSYAARNNGLKIAKGEIIAFTDADCRVCPDWLMQIYMGIGRTGASVALGKRLAASDVSLALKLLENYDNAKIEYVLNQSRKKYFFGFTNNMAVKADVFKSTGMFLERSRGADTEFIQRCLVHNPGVKIAYLPNMQITHLEWKSCRIMFKKKRIYGRNNYLIQKISSYRPLDWRMWLKITSCCTRKNNLSKKEVIFLFFLLIIGLFSYKTGEWRMRLKPGSGRA